MQKNILNKVHLLQCSDTQAELKYILLWRKLFFVEKTKNGGKYLEKEIFEEEKKAEKEKEKNVRRRKRYF